MRLTLRLTLALCVAAITAGCVPRPVPDDMMVDLRGNWAISNAPFGDPDANRAIVPARLVITSSTVLNPFGPDCPERVRFNGLASMPFTEMLAVRQWPMSWAGTLLNGNAIVQEVALTCEGQPFLHLIPLGPSLALATLNNGAAIILRKTEKRPG